MDPKGPCILIHIYWYGVFWYVCLLSLHLFSPISWYVLNSILNFALPPSFGLNNGVTETGIVIAVECRHRYTQALLTFHATEHPLEITSNSLLANLQINIFNLWQILNLLKLHWAMFIILITLLGLIIGHSSSDNNKVRRRYDILNEALNSITVFLPTKYLWFSNSRLGFKQRREKWNEPKIIQFWGFYMVDT